MDSLLANYASSDEDEDQHKPIPSKTTSSSSSSLFPSLPLPKSSTTSLFNFLPPPKQPSSDTPTVVPSNFSQTSSLPKPNSQIHQKPKRLVQFKPPIIPLSKPTELDDDEEDDKEEERNRRRKAESSIQTPSVKSFLSTIPAPRNSSTLGVQSSSGSGRRSILETSTPAPVSSSSDGGSAAVESSVPVDQNGGNYENYQYATDQYDTYGNYSWGVEAEAEAEAGAGSGTASNGDGYGSYGAYEDYGQYGNNWVDGSVATVPVEASGISESVLKFPGKRGRKEVPVEVIEVKQDELIKNRPREDQAKLTGLAFGPSYQVLFSFCFIFLFYG